jgi:hypothetical protein
MSQRERALDAQYGEPTESRSLLRVASPLAVGLADADLVAFAVRVCVSDTTYVTSGKAAKSPSAPPEGLVSKRVASYTNYFSDLPTHPSKEVVRCVCCGGAPCAVRRSGGRSLRPRVYAGFDH